MKRKPKLIQSGRGKISRADAEEIAVAALAFIGADPGRLGLFLGSTGLTPDDLHRQAAEPGFWIGVLDHLVAEEALLVAFAEETSRNPETVVEAWRLLSGPEPEP